MNRECAIREMEDDAVAAGHSRGIIRKRLARAAPPSAETSARILRAKAAALGLAG